jgi:hypothetical protein
VLLILRAAPGCGDNDEQAPAPPERADAPAKPPAGWRTVRNRAAGFTIAVPRSWIVRKKGDATLIRSEDRLAATSLAADRGAGGLGLAPAAYARRTVEALPGFEGALSPQSRRVLGSPYPNARVDARGMVSTSRRPQRISVVAFRRPRRVTYAAVVFRNARVRAPRDARVIARMLRTFRAQPPAAAR